MKLDPLAVTNRDSGGSGTLGLGAQSAGPTAKND